MSLKRVWAYPVHVMIQTTSVCNSACIMCPWPVTSKTLPQGRMDQSLYKKIIDEVSRHPEVEKVMPYLMNEPLTDPRIVDFINLAKQKNPQAEVYIVSNGIALNEDLTERLLASGLDWIGFSVHAIREKTYEQITGRSDFEKIRDGVTRFIRRAREVGKHDKYVMINLTRVRPYVSDEEVKEAFAYWKSQGIDPVDYVDGYISRAGNVNVWNTDKPFHTRIQGCKTLWAYKMVHILFNGDVVPCCMDWDGRRSGATCASRALSKSGTGRKGGSFRR